MTENLNRIRTISSRQNPQFKRWTSLLETQGIQKHGQCLVSGKRLGAELLQHPVVPVCEILTPFSSEHAVTGEYRGPVFGLSGELFNELDIFGTKNPLLICQVPPLPDFDLESPPEGLELVCPMGEPGNLGAVIRGCLAFGVKRLILLTESVHPFHPKVIRASSGAVFSISIFRGGPGSALSRPEYAQWITALDLEGQDLGFHAWPTATRLLIGEEGKGIPPGPYPRRLRIPQTHTTIPLNAAVAAHIALYSYRQGHPHQS